jgi:hypothetical protein
MIGQVGTVLHDTRYNKVGTVTSQDGRSRYATRRCRTMYDRTSRVATVTNQDSTSRYVTRRY